LLKQLQYDPGPINGFMSDPTRKAAALAQLDMRVHPDLPPLTYESAARWCFELEKHRVKAFVSTRPAYVSDVAPGAPALRIVRSGVDAAREIFNVDVPVTIYAYENQDLGIAALRREAHLGPSAAKTLWSTTAGNAMPGTIVISLYDLERSHSNVAGFWAAAHEYSHVAAADITRHSQVNDAPFWLAEGLADEVADRALLSRGYQNNWNDASARLMVMIEQKKGRAKHILRRLESAALSDWEMRKSYDLAHIAVRLLIRKTSFETVTSTYWRRRARHPGESWRTTFAQVFGVSVSDFYSEFDIEVAPAAR
jgi:hypothetical protein